MTTQEIDTLISAVRFSSQNLSHAQAVLTGYRSRANLTWDQNQVSLLTSRVKDLQNLTFRILENLGTPDIV